MLVVLSHIKKLLVVIVGSILFAASMNLFLIPANVYSSGFSGLSQLLARIFSDFLHIDISVGIFLFLLNIPVTILGWVKIGKSFTLYSFLSVIITSVFLNIIPIYSLSHDILLNAVFGGVIGAIGVGMTLRYGASTGGLDIIALVLSRKMDQPVGKYTMMLNSIIILSAGYLFGWEKALYTLVVLFSSSKVIDIIHTQSQKLTAMIVTKNTSDLKKEILKQLTRGVTIVPARGAYSEEGKELLITVISRYELFELKRIIKEIDPKAFTNILQTESVIGVFRKS
ncbi:YitT family protein [Caldibacillus lycopersici]|uniref:YitT family protein n=1 Tax=Perspicuibacillus lycopersici TaxID=1325689 RepID=A0AAE3IQ08_9BACI|nr:YitT family protein [Perspicuibacillus lycopersici]MCU9612455.1 YitT family protein [Perspicuibacillus lycopersici]